MNEAGIAEAIAAAEARFGAIEEGEDAAVRALFDTNVFGLAATRRAVLPGMRRRGRGFVVNLSSIAGLSSNPGSGYYAASKFAVEAISEALAAEVAGFGIRDPSGRARPVPD